MRKKLPGKTLNKTSQVGWATPCTLYNPFPPKLNQVPQRGYSEFIPNSPSSRQDIAEHDATNKMAFYGERRTMFQCKSCKK